jgi:uncharacterized protein YoxC
MKNFIRKILKDIHKHLNEFNKNINKQLNMLKDNSNKLLNEIRKIMQDIKGGYNKYIQISPKNQSENKNLNNQNKKLS